ncbi:MAG: MopE-related protein [Pseudomonadota bacterium]
MVFEANGFYYNELTGELSNAPITLRACPVLTGTGMEIDPETETEVPIPVHLNILTHLTFERKTGSDIAKYITQDGQLVCGVVPSTVAEAELLVALQIGPPEYRLQNPCDDIESRLPDLGESRAHILGGDTDANAFLLAVSAIFAQAAQDRGGSFDATLQELLNNTSLDLADDGELKPELVAELHAAEMALDTRAVMDLLSLRLADIGALTPVPDIDRIIDSDRDGQVNSEDCRPRDPDRWTGHADLDSDGHDALGCGGDDCDDDNPLRYTGATEVCDANDVDEDCDPSTFGFRDSDGDGAASAACCNSDGLVEVCGSDCDDANSVVCPTCTEIDGNSVDDDCDGVVDELAGQEVCNRIDDDNNGFIDEGVLVAANPVVVGSIQGGNLAVTEGASDYGVAWLDAAARPFAHRVGFDGIADPSHLVQIDDVTVANFGVDVCWDGRHYTVVYSADRNGDGLTEGYFARVDGSSGGAGGLLVPPTRFDDPLFGEHTTKGPTRVRCAFRSGADKVLVTWLEQKATESDFDLIRSTELVEAGGNLLVELGDDVTIFEDGNWVLGHPAVIAGVVGAFSVWDESSANSTCFRLHGKRLGTSPTTLPVFEDDCQAKEIIPSLALDEEIGTLAVGFRRVDGATTTAGLSLIDLAMSTVPPAITINDATSVVVASAGTQAVGALARGLPGAPELRQYRSTDGAQLPGGGLVVGTSMQLLLGHRTGSIRYTAFGLDGSGLSVQDLTCP